MPVWLSLIFVTALGMVTMGYQASLVGSKRARAMIPLIVAFCVILTMALDRLFDGACSMGQSMSVEQTPCPRGAPRDPPVQWLDLGGERLQRRRLRLVQALIGLLAQQAPVRQQA